MTHAGMTDSYKWMVNNSDVWLCVVKTCKFVSKMVKKYLQNPEATLNVYRDEEAPNRIKCNEWKM